MEVLKEVSVVGIEEDLYQEMVAAGYLPQAPSEEVGMLDALVFERGKCSSCGEKGGLAFHPFWRESPRSYRPFVVCVACGYTREV